MKIALQVALLLAATGAAQAQTTAQSADPATTVQTAAQAAPVATPAPASQPAATGQPDPAAAAASKTVPPLAIRWDCGKCEQNEKVIPLVEQEYAAYAKEAGFTVNSALPAIPVRISDFRQRPAGVRVMFGIMAGKDRLLVKLDDHGKEVELGDTVANAWVGMNFLCAQAGSALFKYMSSGKIDD